MNQLSFDSLMKPRFKIDKPIKLIELFAGIGSQAKALERLGIHFEHHIVCEYDRPAIKSYNAIHETNFNTSDITQLKGSDLNITDTDKFTYLLTYSFPCQDLSVAGKQRGMSKDSGTRSGLLWEVERLLNECDELPQVLLMENVTQVHSDANYGDWVKWLQYLESKGYSNYWKDLNAKDYTGVIPQNRNRCFMVSVLGDYYYEFPQPIPLTKVLKDVLDESVDEKYYISDKGIEYLTFQDENRGESLDEYDEKRLINIAHGQCKGSTQSLDIHPTLLTDTAPGWKVTLLEPLKIKEATSKGYAEATDGDSVNLDYPESNTRRGRVGKGVAQTLTTSCNQGVVERCIQVGQLYGTDVEPNPQAGRVYSDEGLSPTLDSCSGGNRMPKITVVGNYSPSGHDASRIVDEHGLAPTVKENHGTVTAVARGYRIRKLTEKECYRLMGFDDEDYEKAAMVVSSAQLYKQAGNSIVVNVLERIFKQMI